MTEPGARILYEFNGFRLDLQQRLLMRSADGAPVPLAPKIFETLLYFVERRGELLDKTTLMKAIWPNIVVEENSLNQNISALRRALGESPGEHRFIVTEPGRGYRFVADVRVLTVPTAETLRSPGAEADRKPAPAPSAAAQTRKSIAVLPFANLTGDASKEYFGDGMAEELIHTLARIPGLRVPARTSSFAYKGRNVDVRQIARDLDVGAVLEGSVRSAGERIRVTAQLIDGQNGYHVWSQSYDRKFDDLFELQDELAQAIVQTLRLSLDERVSEAIHGPPTQNLEAYHLYLQALAVQGTANPEYLARAMQMLQRAIALDPGFARAYNAMAGLRAIAIVIDVHVPGTFADAEQEVNRALSLDPSLVAAHAALGMINAARGRWIDAEGRFRQAFAHDDSDPTTKQMYGLHVAGSTGFLQRYLENSQLAHRLAPAWMPNVLSLAVANMLLERHDETEKFIRLTRNLGIPPTMPVVADIFAQLAVRAGRHDEAADLIANALPPGIVAIGGSDVVRKALGAMHAVHDSSPRMGAVQGLDSLRAQAAPKDMTQIMKRRLMLWYTQLGALDQAYAVANESLDYFARSGIIGTAWGILWGRELLPFRQDPRFQALVRRMNLPEYWDRFGPPDNCDWRQGTLICR